MQCSGSRNADLSRLCCCIRPLHMSQDLDSESHPLLVTSSPEPHPARKQEQWVAPVNQPPTPSTSTLLLFSGAIMLSILTAVSFFAFRRSFEYPSSTSHTGVQFASPEIQRFWGAYTPYFPAQPYIPPPSHCQITQVRWFLFCLKFLIIDL